MQRSASTSSIGSTRSNNALKGGYEALLRIGGDVSDSRSVYELCANTVRSLSRTFGSEDAAIYLISSDGLSLVHVVHHVLNAEDSLLDECRIYPANVGRMEELVTKRAIVVTSYLSPSPFDVVPDSVAGRAQVSVVVPVYAGCDTLGLYSLTFEEKSPPHYDDDLLIAVGGLIGTLIRVAGKIAESQSISHSLAYRNLCDELNGKLGRIAEAIADGARGRRWDASAEDLRSLEQLTPTERHVVSLAGSGFSNLEIAGRLFISEATVKRHISSILLKTGASNRVQLALFAVRTGLVEP